MSKLWGIDYRPWTKSPFILRSAVVEKETPKCYFFATHVSLGGRYSKRIYKDDCVDKYGSSAEGAIQKYRRMLAADIKRQREKLDAAKKTLTLFNTWAEAPTEDSDAG